MPVPRQSRREIVFEWQRRKAKRRRLIREGHKRPDRSEPDDLPTPDEGDDGGECSDDQGPLPSPERPDSAPKPSLPEPATPKPVLPELTLPNSPHHGKVLRRVDCIIVNYKTLDLTKIAVDSFTQHYPEIPLILIDNYSQDGSTNYLKGYYEEHAGTTLVINSTNVGHGPALHQGILLSTAEFVFTLDSDCLVLSRGFIELMLDNFISDPFLYAIGRRIYTNHNGVPYPHQHKDHTAKIGVPYIHPFAMMLRRDRYLHLPPFLHSGAPAISNMRQAFVERAHIKHFPIYEYVRHYGAGTRKMFGGSWKAITDSG